MLVFPPEWKRCTVAHVSKNLMKATAGRDRSTCAACLVTAALDLLVSGRRKRCSSYPDYKRISKCVWRINDWTLRYHPRITDRTLARFRRLLLARPSPLSTSLVRRGQCEVLRAAIQSLNKTAPDVQDLEGFLEMRVLLTAIDFGWTIERTLLYLLDRYNHHVRSESPTLVVQLPQNGVGNR
jgi:hypothetical protein